MIQSDVTKAQSLGGLSNELETRFVFIDTEAYVREKLDWESKSLTKFVELAKARHVQVLVNSITRQEVIEKIRESLYLASSALKKHEVIIRLLGNEIASICPDGDAAAILIDRFQSFLVNAKAIDVPLNVDVNALFACYFERKPPFSDKKKHEFPDAVVVSSLLQWCEQRGATVYVVSSDPDMLACCEGAGGLIPVASVAEIVSRATVRKNIHDAILRSLAADRGFLDVLKQKLVGEKISAFRGRGRYGRSISVEGSVYDVGEIELGQLNVLDRRHNQFLCSLAADAKLEVELEIVKESGFRDPGRSSRNYFLEVTSLYRQFSVDVDVTLNLDSLLIEDLDAIYLHQGGIELDDGDVPDV